MAFRGLPRHDGLQAATRLPGFRKGEQALPALEVIALLFIGGLATCLMVFWDWGLRIPGHAILRSVFPMVLGLALVPRRGAGTVMGAGALTTLTWMQFGGLASPGWGSMTSLLLIGPMLDFALWSAQPGRRMLLRFALAGFAANFAAFLVRGTTKYFSLPGGGTRPFASWLSPAILTYAVCGLLAGLISALVWFHTKGQAEP
jgi:hypothetical protein